MSIRNNLLSVMLLSLFIVTGTLGRSAREVSAIDQASLIDGNSTESIKIDKCSGSRDGILRETSVNSHPIMSLQHTSLAYIQGYAMTLTKCSNQSDTVNNIQFNFTSMLSINNTTYKTINLSGANSSLTIVLAEERRYEKVTVKSSEYSSYSNVYYDSSSSEYLADSPYKFYTFHSIHFKDADENIDCLALKPDLFGFREDEYYGCDARRVITCRHTDYPSEIVMLVFDQMHFEIDGNHDKIFSGVFSKKPRNCLDKKSEQDQVGKSAKDNS